MSSRTLHDSGCAKAGKHGQRRALYWKGKRSSAAKLLGGLGKSKANPCEGGTCDGGRERRVERRAPEDAQVEQERL